MKIEKIYILIGKDEKRYKRKVNARVFEKEGIKLAIVGNCKKGYSLTHIQTGLAITFAYKLKDITKNLNSIIERFKKIPEEYITNGIKLFNEAEFEE